MKSSARFSGNIGGGLWGASFLALTLAVAPTAAQSGDTSGTAATAAVGPAAENTAATDIVVTGSRVARSGFDTPTPTTVLGADAIAKAGRPNLADTINTLPALRPSQTPSSSSNGRNAGGNYLDLRGLGPTRTLVLLDGNRLVPSVTTGVTDLNLLPQALIASVDVVTGGASAAYGSDAVAGVVNLKLDHSLRGLKASLQGGITDHGDHRNYRASLAYGAEFAEGRGKLLVGGEIADNRGVGRATERAWGRQGWDIVPNPSYTPTNGQPLRLVVPNVVFANQSVGGVINSGPLRGIQFGVGGQPIPFTYGAYASSTLMSGGDGGCQDCQGILEAPTRRKSVYAGVSYELADWMTARVDGAYAQSDVSLPSFVIPSESAITIFRDNAFLPASIRTAMTNLGLASFTMGRYSPDYAQPLYHNDTNQRRVTAGLAGKLGGGWSWDLGYSYGQVKTDLAVSNDRITANYNLAVDAVVNPATGAIVCRSTLTSPNNGCVPINLFGVGSPSQAAINYVMGTSRLLTDITQHAASLTIRGTPISTWAGPVSLAFGGEFRRLSIGLKADPISSSFGFYTYNLAPWSGRQTVKEGFAEAVMPLAADMAWAKKIDLDLAVRLTDYSTSGRVTTWKAGANWAINNDIRLRATRSRDIRAPNLNEIFAAASLSRFTVVDPVTLQSVSAVVTTQGNRNLKPEKADTTSFGFILTPRFLRGLSLSVDAYNIDIKQAITTFSAASIVSGCYTTQPALCTLITRGPGGNGSITGISAVPQNLASQLERGIDVEVNYGSRLFGGGSRINIHGLATYIDTFKIRNGLTTTQYAGALDQASIDTIGGQPRWRASIDIGFERGPISIDVMERYVSGGRIVAGYTALDIDRLFINGRAYTDLSAEYRIVDSKAHPMSVFTSIQNLFNKAPPIAPTAGFGTVRSLYDTIGRVYNLGVRVKY